MAQMILKGKKVIRINPITNTNNAINIMVGTWKEDMGGKSVTVVIEKINNNTVIGCNVF